MGDGSALQFPASAGAAATLSTDPRRRVTFAWSGIAARRETGYGAYLQTNAQVTLRFRPELELTLLPTAVFDHGLRRYVGTDASLVEIGSPADYRFATQNANSAGITVRAAYTFTPELSCSSTRSSFSPPFITARSSSIQRRRFANRCRSRRSCPLAHRPRTPTRSKRR